MDDFAKTGNLGSGDAIAALTLIRALLRRLEFTGVLNSEDVTSIIASALEQIPTGSIPRLVEARRLIGEFSQ